MNNFAQAKKQTLKRWGNILDARLTKKWPKFTWCGFCTEYGLAWGDKHCPVCNLKDIIGQFLSYREPYARLADRQIPLVMAVLIYVWGMEDEG